LTPETDLFLRKAYKLLAEATAMLDVGLYEAAGRTAYMVAFHTAQALLSEDANRTIKTHKGVHTAFQRLTKDDATLDPELRAFLSRLYNLKAIADYETGLNTEVGRDQATRAVVNAEQFVAFFAKRLGAAS
jgi:uncharacterized protein (UPF0332 family)